MATFRVWFSVKTLMLQHSNNKADFQSIGTSLEPYQIVIGSRELDWGSIRSSLKYGLGDPVRLAC